MAWRCTECPLYSLNLQLVSTFLSVVRRMEEGVVMCDITVYQVVGGAGMPLAGGHTGRLAGPCTAGVNQTAVAAYAAAAAAAQGYVHPFRLCFALFSVCCFFDEI